MRSAAIIHWASEWTDDIKYNGTFKNVESIQFRSLGL